MTPTIECVNGYSPADEIPESELHWSTDGRATAVFVGRIDANNKGLDLLVDAVSQLEPGLRPLLTLQGPEWGDGAALRLQADRVGISDLVKVLPPDYTVTSGRIMARHDIFCLTSRFEGFGLAALEAMLAGRVMMVSDIAGIAPFVRAAGCGVVVDPDVRSVREGFIALQKRRRSGRRWGWPVGTTCYRIFAGTRSRQPCGSNTPPCSRRRTLLDRTLRKRALPERIYPGIHMNETLTARPPETALPLPVDKSLRCPNCHSQGMSTFYSVKNIPVHSTVNTASPEEALTFPKGQLKLGFCPACGFVSNTLYDSSVQEYCSNCEESQGFSPTFNAFAKKLAQTWIDRYDIHNKTVLEIGCGKGEFLVLMCELGNNRGIGVDPSYQPARNARGVQETR